MVKIRRPDGTLVDERELLGTWIANPNNILDTNNVWKTTLESSWTPTLDNISEWAWDFDFLKTNNIIKPDQLIQDENFKNLTLWKQREAITKMWFRDILPQYFNAWDKIKKQQQEDINKLSEQAQAASDSLKSQLESARWKLELSKQQIWQNIDLDSYNKIQSNISDVEKQLWKWITDINQISQNTWLDSDTINRIISWDITKDIWLTEKAATEERQAETKWLESLNKQKQDKLDELDRKTTWAVELFDKSIQNVKDTMERDLWLSTFVWAAKWSTQASWFYQWLDNIRQDYQTEINKIRRNRDEYKSDIIKAENSIIDDFNSKVETLNTDLQKSVTDFKIWLISDLQNIQTQFDTTDEKYIEAIDKLQEQVDASKNNIAEKYTKLYQQQLTNFKEYNNRIDQLNKEQSVKQDNYFTGLLSNNWQLLLNNSINDILDKFEKWYIREDQVEQSIEYLKSLTQNTLSQYATLSTEDLNKIDSLLNQWFTPQEIISQFSATEKFKNADTKEWNYELRNLWQDMVVVIDKDTWEEIRRITKDWVNTEIITTPIIQKEQINNTLESFKSKYTVWDVWGQCGKFVNDYLDNIWVWRIYTDPINEKQATVNTQTPEAGSVVVFDYTNNPNATLSQQKYWHVAIVESVNTDWTFNTIESNKWWEEKIFKRQNINPKNVYWFYNPNLTKPTELVESTDEWIMWVLWVPVFYERQIKSQVPATLMNSEIELKQLNDTIKSMYEWWLDPLEASLTFAWFDVKDSNVKEQWMQFVNIGRTMWEDIPDWFYAQISNFVNKWNLKWAMTLTENVLKNVSKKQDPDWYISERTTKTMVRRADELLDLVKKLEESWDNPIGTFSGTFEEWLWRFKSQDAVKIANKASRLVSDFRKQNLWTAVTESESAFLSSVIPNLFDSTENFNTKIEEFKWQALWEINDLRSIYNVPLLDENTLLDTDERVKLYQNTMNQWNKKQITIPSQWVGPVAPTQSKIDLNKIKIKNIIGDDEDILWSISNFNSIENF